jgi:hypothetical protein
MRYTVMAVAGLLVAGAASSGTIDDVLMRQKNGMWETTSATGKKTLFCVTDSVKVGAQKQTLESMKELGCRTVKDVVKGDDYELHHDCANPTFGKFQMTMKGTVRSDFMSNSGTITGGGEFIQSLAKNPELQGEEWRWLRPCRAGEKPGLQD